MGAHAGSIDLPGASVHDEFPLIAGLMQNSFCCSQWLAKGASI